MQKRKNVIHNETKAFENAYFFSESTDVYFSKAWVIKRMMANSKLKKITQLHIVDYTITY